MFGASSTLLNADHNEVYFKGMPVWNGKVLKNYITSPSLQVVNLFLLPFARFIQVLRRHGDVFERTSKGYYHAHGRADDTMNLGGIKVSIWPHTIELY